MAKKKSSIATIFAEIRADYDMSRASRFVRRRTGVAPQGSGADFHYRNEFKYYADIEQARDFDRNDPLICTIVDRRVDNIVQQGFVLDPKTGDKKLDDDLKSRWAQFANEPELCDIAGESTFPEIERQCERSSSVDGDIVVTGTEDGPLQVIESHLIQNKTKIDSTFCGVTTDQYGKRTQYHLLEETGAFGQTKQGDPVNVRDADGIRQLFHVYNPRRVNQTRGVTQLAPIFTYSGLLEDINVAKLVQQQVVSCYSILRTFPAGMDGLPSAVGFGGTSTETSGNATRDVVSISPGAEYTGAPGEMISGFSPNIPNSEYFQQVRFISQIIGVNFGLPLCLILMDGSETNFSGWRGAVDEARKGFVTDQLNLVRRLHRPVYTWKLNQWIKEDSALARAKKKSGIAIFNHVWNLPTWNYIEPVADAQGDAEQLKNALTSPRRLHAARGKDWEEVSEEIVADNSYAIDNAMAKAAEMNAKFPQGPAVLWRDLISLPMPAGVTMAMQDPAAVKVQAANNAIPQDSEGTELLPGETKLTGLNGAQVSSLAAIIEQVTTGVMPKETAKAMINAAFPDLGDARINAILDPIKEGEAAGEALEKKAATAADVLPGDEPATKPIKSQRKPRKAKA